MKIYFFLAFLCTTVFCSHAIANDLYLTSNTNAITEVDPSTGIASSALQLSSTGVGIEIDPIEGKVYWTQSGDRFVRRANLDGTDVESVFDLGTVSSFGGSIALNSVERQLYYSSFNEQNDGGIIGRVNFDGSNPTTLAILDESGGGPLTVDPVGERVYWATQETLGVRNVRSIDFNGEDLQVLAQGRRYADIDVDSVNEKLYWVTVDTGDRRIQRSNLDGSNLEDFLPDTLDFSAIPDYVHLPQDIAVDPLGDRLYWTNSDFRDSRVLSVRLDGTDIMEVYRNTSDILTGLAVVPTAVPEPSNVLLLTMASFLFGLRRSRC